MTDLLINAEKPNKNKKGAYVTKKEQARLEKERLHRERVEMEARQAEKDEQYDLPFKNPMTVKHKKEIGDFFDDYYKRYVKRIEKKRASTTIASDTISRHSNL